MTDSEAWAVIGETINQSKQLYWGILCFTLVQACREQIINPYQWRRMEHQLYKYRRRYSKGTTHFWPVKQIAPRVRACMKLARITA